ncbi:hypothetical protein [Sulfitobacter noctilucae]|uniref:hypothetical protein n=1 Tax=Sulfitobacter noctilucae TaxID=1342302 RepID=UPI0004693AA9|nr:hypothetical protein [Sulfitobacter noctilucae]
MLVPRTEIATIKAPWRLEDGVSLINELNAKVIVISVTDCDWELIQKARSRTQISVGTIIQCIREGALRISSREGMQGYKNFCVNKKEVDQLVADNSEGLKKKPQYPDGVVSTASAFGRSIGMRENEAFIRLVRAGHTPASHVDISTAGKKRFYVTEDDIAAFHRDYLTQNTMAVEFNGFWRTLIARLQAAGVKPFTSGRE